MWRSVGVFWYIDFQKCILMDDLTLATLKLLDAVKKKNQFYLEMEFLEEPWPLFEVLKEYWSSAQIGLGMMLG